MSAEIVVVGAGPTGMTLGCQLLRRGVAVRVVERAEEPTTRSRAIGISARSLEVLDEFGAADQLVPLGVPCPTANFYSGTAPVGRLSLAGLRDARYPFMLAIPQSETERVLEQRLVELGGRVERGTRLRHLAQQAGKVQLVLDAPGGEQTAEADWVVGADGGRSTVRRQGVFSFRASGPENVFVIVDTIGSSDYAPGEGQYHLGPDGMTVIVPLADGTLRIAASVDGAAADAELTLDDVRALVRRRVGGKIRIDQVRSAGWGIARARVQARIADRMRDGRCFLAGDAAHVYGPVGGQGMNGGIQDAHNLAWKLALVSTGRARESLLDTYESERMPAAEEALHSASLQTRMAILDSRPKIALRDGFLRVSTAVGLLDRKLGPKITQLGVDYKGSPGIAEGGSAALGLRLPDVPLDGGATRLFALLRDNEFTALVIGAGPGDGTAVGEVVRDVRERFGELVTPLAVGRAPGVGGIRSVADDTGRLRRALGAKTASVALVRPDGHVAAVAPLAEGRRALRGLRAQVGLEPAGAA